MLRNKGIVPALGEQRIRIDLADGGQSQIRPLRKCPIGFRVLQFLDEKFDKMYTEGKLVFLNEPIPITYPAFVVWRKTGSTERGRVVIDLRLLNKIAILDVYPLADQEDIIEAV